ncbi:MAG: hypothetical protein P8090_15250 [Gammaproteobacteria bacterium]
MEALENLEVWKRACSLSVLIYQRTQIYIGMEIALIDEVTGRKLVSRAREISKMLQGLLNTLPAD